ncbi:MAG: class I SAM-dependent methyltransferase [Spirochaetales bacterium]|nr:class I SAM-dependent methyltransferase [Spirochaetales bacterium]
MAQDTPGVTWRGPCPLCGREEEHPLFYRDRRRPYYRCGRCDLTFVPPPWQVSPEDEKARYDYHRNDGEDRGYRDFLGRIIPFVQENLASGAVSGLDFGCGPAPVLAGMFADQGYGMEAYDLYYRNRGELLEGGKNYDFITGTEVFEHLARPGETAAGLLRLLNREGILALMTRFLEDGCDFSRWFYKDDETHICFFSRRSFLWLAASLGRRAVFRDKDMVILTEGGADNEQYET